MIGDGIGGRKPEEIADGERIGATPLDAALAVKALEIPHEVHEKNRTGAMEGHPGSEQKGWHSVLAQASKPDLRNICWRQVVNALGSESGAAPPLRTQSVHNQTFDDVFDPFMLIEKSMNFRYSRCANQTVSHRPSSNNFFILG